METPLYQEDQLIGRWFVLLVLFVTLIMIASTFVVPTQERVYFLALSVFVIALVSTFFRMRVVVTASELRFGFMLWRKRFPLEEIEIVGVEPIPFIAGAGIHFHRGRWVYNARLLSEGVHLVYQGKKHYLIGSDNAEALLRILKTATTPRHLEQESVAHESG